MILTQIIKKTKVTEGPLVCIPVIFFQNFSERHNLL